MHGLALTVLLAAGGLSGHVEPRSVSVGEWVQLVLVAEGGVPPYSFSVDYLPGGLFLQNNQISGPMLFPTCDYTSRWIPPRFRVTDATGDFFDFDLDIEVRCPPLTLHPESLEDTHGLVNAEGGEPPYSYTVTNLPSGVTSAAHPPTSVELEGVPLSGCATATVVATDQRGSTGQKSWLLCSDDAAFEIRPAELSDGMVGQPYEVQFSADWPTQFRLHAGQVPPGLTMDGSGLLQGTPDSGGVFDFSLVAVSGGLTVVRDYELLVSEPQQAPPHPHTIACCSASSGPATLAPLGLLLFLRRRRRPLAP